MPSSPGYVRDYQQELKTSVARGERPRRAARNRDRRKAIKLGLLKPGDKRTLDHKRALSEGGKAGSKSNWRIASAHDNYSYARNADGSMKNNK